MTGGLWRRRRRGVTLVELLVVTAVIGVLAGLAIPIVASVTAAGEQASEVSAARTLIKAYHGYAADHGGRLMPGYGRFPAADEEGNPIGFPASGRYPWRLAPYFDYDFRAIYVNSSRQRLAAMGPDNSYGLSVSPSLGMNTGFVGGDYEHLHPQGLGAHYGPFCVTRLVQAHQPSRLIVFASARSDAGGEQVEGYYRITPPNMTRRQWRERFDESAPASSFGFVHPRHDGRAVAAMLDGHVESLDSGQLQDMRRWANPAALADDPDWRLGQPAK